MGRAYGPRMNDTRRGFIRLSVYFVGGAALGGCGSPNNPPGGDGGTGGGSTGGGTGGGSTGGGGGSTGGGGGSTGGGGGGGGGGTASTCSTNGAAGTAISLNHGHSLVVPAADFSNTGDMTYDITGTSLHAHTITLTQAQRATILGGTPVTVTSTLVGHSHSVTVACA